VVVQPEERDRLTSAVIAIEDQLDAAGLGSKPELALATLARAAQRFLAELTDANPDLGKKRDLRKVRAEVEE
jgi:hypothetical protein